MTARAVMIPRPDFVIYAGMILRASIQGLSWTRQQQARKLRLTAQGKHKIEGRIALTCLRFSILTRLARGLGV
jgi:hypothetical protein